MVLRRARSAESAKIKHRIENERKVRAASGSRKKKIVIKSNWTWTFNLK
jgi:hypothetical protein